jgi:Ca2+-binding RTX toxin-like protein
MLSQTGISRWIGPAAMLALAAALLLPSAALAVPPAVVSFGGGVANVNATTGSEDELVLSRGGIFFRVDAPTSKVIAAGGCSGPPTQTFVSCLTIFGASLQRIAVNLGNKDDTVNLSQIPATVTSTLNGGRGDDRITGGPGADAIIGGRGQDLARGGAGNDNLNMRDGSRDVRIDCGAGTDRAKLDRRDPRPRNCERVSRR